MVPRPPWCRRKTSIPIRIGPRLVAEASGVSLRTPGAMLPAWLSRSVLSVAGEQRQCGRTVGSSLRGS